MSSICIKAVKTGSDLRRFISFPYDLYKNDSCYVPPLRGDMKKQLVHHPFNTHSESSRFIADSNGKTIGRIAVIVDDNYNSFHNVKAGFFGYFECVEDKSAAHSLLDVAVETLKAKKVDFILGPASPSSNGDFGLLVKGFDQIPSLLMPYHKPYYQDYIEDFGFTKAKDLLAFEVHKEKLDENVMNLLERIVARQLVGKKLKIREVDKSRFEAEVKIMLKLYNSAWKRNWGFVPMTDEEFMFEAKALLRILDPRIVLVAEIDDDPKAFILSVPNFNIALQHARGRLFPFGFLKILYYSRKINNVRTILLGVADDFRDRGLAATLYFETIRRGIKAGYDWSECSWILEDNTNMCKPLRRIGGEVKKVYRVYEYRL